MTGAARRGLAAARDRLQGHARLGRYGIAGGLSFLTHLAVLVALVEAGLAAPVPASVAGFAASVAVSFTLQYRWVFRSSAPLFTSFGRFLVVTVLGLLLNVLIMAVGVNGLKLHYLAVQFVAFAAVPISNYLLNRAWTFRAAESIEECWPVADVLLLAAMSVLVTTLGLYSVLHLDLARDLSVAADMVAGRAWPLKGPELAGSLYLGPVWYWFLAFMQFVRLEVVGSVAAVAALASAQFWLAWRAGCEWHGQTTGLLAAAFLLVPSWPLYQFVLISHPVLVGSCLAATFLAGVRFAKTGRGVHLILMSMFFSLALHAHPASLVLAFMPLGLAVSGWQRGGVRWRTLGLAAAVALLPFVPAAIDEIKTGGWLLAGLNDYLGHAQSRGRLSQVLPLAWALTGGGLEYWLVYMAKWPLWPARLLAVTYAGIVVLGATGSVARIRAGDRISLVLLAAVVAGLGGLAMIRSFYPHYMVSGVGFCLMLLAAAGWSWWLELLRLGRRTAAAVAAAVLVFTVPLVAGVANSQQSASLPFATFPVFNVTAQPEAHQPHPFLSAAGASASADWLCSHEHAVVHGAYAVSLIHSYAIEARLRCGKGQFRAGGRHENGQHWLGLALPMLESLGIQPQQTAGGLGLVRARRVLTPSAALRLEKHRGYPPLAADFGQDRTGQHVIETSGQEWLVVTDMTFGMARPAAVEMHCGDRPVKPVVTDRMVRVYDGHGCDGDLTLTVQSTLPDLVTLVALPRRPPDG